jgi:hypothetical protein
VFLALRELQDGDGSPERKLPLVEQAMVKAPSLAPLHLICGKCLTQLQRVGEAKAAYRKGLACSPDPDVKTRRLVELAMQVDDEPQRLALLREAQVLGGNLVAAAAATLALRAVTPN